MKLKILICVIVSFVFTACFEVEEKIVLTSADAGNFSLTIDMSKLLGQLKVFGGTEQFNGLQAKDTIIYFKGRVTEDTSFTTLEKQLLSGGSMQLNMNVDKDQMKAVFTAPFTSISQVGQLRNALLKIISMSGKNSLTNMPDAASLGKGLSLIDLNSLGYTFIAQKGSITNTLTDSANLQVILQQDSVLQQVKLIAPMLNVPATYTRTFTFTTPVKNYSAQKGTLSTDRKTLLIKNDFQDLFDNPRSFEYVITY